MEDEWGHFRARAVLVEKVENYTAKHQPALNKFGVYSVPNFIAFVVKEYMEKHK